MSEDDGIHENTLAGIEWAAAVALDMSMGAPCGRWVAETCADSTAALRKFAVRFQRDPEHLGEYPRGGAEFVRLSLDGLPEFARTIVALVAEVRRLRKRDVERDAKALRILADSGDPVARAALNAPVVPGESSTEERAAMWQPSGPFISHETIQRQLLDRAKVEHAALTAEIERLRTRDARIPSLGWLCSLLTKYRAQSHGEPIDLLGAIQTAEARAEAAREHPDPNVRRVLLLDCAAWALAAVCEIDGAQASAQVAVTREANDEGSGP